MIRWTGRQLMKLVRVVFGCAFGHDVEYLRPGTRCRKCGVYNCGPIWVGVDRGWDD